MAIARMLIIITTLCFALCRGNDEYDNYIPDYGSGYSNSYYDPSPNIWNKAFLHNEDRPVNKIHLHEEALISLFGSDKNVHKSVYSIAYKDTYMSLAQVKLSIEKRVQSPEKETNMSVVHRNEINEVIEILEKRMKELELLNAMPWLLRTLVNASSQISTVVDSSMVFHYLEIITEKIKRQEWSCYSDDLGELWEEIIKSSRKSCLSEGSCFKEMEEKREIAIEGLARVSLAVINTTKRSGLLDDADGSKLKRRIMVLNILSKESNLKFSGKNPNEIRDRVNSLLCKQITVTTFQDVMSCITPQPKTFVLLEENPESKVIDTEEISALLEVQQNLGEAIQATVTNIHRVQAIPVVGEYLLDSFMDLVDYTLDTESTDAWAKMPREEANNKLHQMLLGNERYIGTVSEIIFSNSAKGSKKHHDVDKSSMSVSMSKINVEEDVSATAEFDYEDVQIWTDNLLDLENNSNETDNNIKVYALRYKSWASMVHDIMLEHSNETHKNSTELKMNTNSSSRVKRDLQGPVSVEMPLNKTFVGNGGIISLSARHRGKKKTIPVTYWMKFNVALSQPFAGRTSQHCLSCEYLEPETLKWRSHGCHVVTANDTGITCRCNHTTNFAAFMMPAEIVFPTSETDLLTLKVFSMAGSILSVFGLIFSLMVFFLVKKLVRNDRLTAHMHLSFALLVVHVIYLFGDLSLKIENVCIASTVMSHFFLLASFMWMLVEGIFLYLYVVQVFLRSRIVTYKWMYLVGWGVPLVVVMIAAGYGIPQNKYVKISSNKTARMAPEIKCPSGSLHFLAKFSEEQDETEEATFERCWLSTESGMIWSFLGPALFVLVFNTFIMAKTLQVCIKKFNSTLHMRKSNQIWKGTSSQGNMKSIPPFISEAERSSENNTYDHLHGESKTYHQPTQVEQAKPTIFSTSPCLLQVISDEEEDRRGSADSTNSNLLAPPMTPLLPGNGNSANENSLPSLDKPSPLRSGNDPVKEESSNLTPYHSSVTSARKFSNTTTSVLYRNSIFHSPKISIAKTMAKNGFADLAVSEKKVFLEDAKRAVKGAIVLLPILGVPWVCGVLSHLSPVFMYLFVILNSTQGLAIFVVYCICNGEVRRAIKRRFDVKTMQYAVDAGVRRSSSTSTSRGLLRFGRRRSTVTTTA